EGRHSLDDAQSPRRAPRRCGPPRVAQGREVRVPHRRLHGAPRTHGFRLGRLLQTRQRLEELLLMEKHMNVMKAHLSFNVTNIDASVAFYEKVFGVAATKRRPGYAKFDLAAPSLNLTMLESPRTGVNVSHFGIQ